MNPKTVTYEQLDQLLRDLGFESQKLEPRWKRYEHSSSGTVILLGDKKSTAHALASEVISARFQLDHRGLLEEAEFNRRLTRTESEAVPDS